ncbi:MAG: DUF1552 domain-containing protein [Myxococcales bacterium]
MTRPQHSFSRRTLLRGVGVCLALPYLESLAPRSLASAQAAPAKRFIASYFPNGAAADYWPVKGSGAGWTLSPLLAPLAAHKRRLVVFSNLENYSPMQDNQGVEPSHARLCGAFLTCVDSDAVREKLKVEMANGISMDQVIAAQMKTTLPSLELGLSTLNSYEDGRHPSLSRSIAWASTTQPLYKEVNPQAVFDRLVAAGAVDASGAADPQVAAQAARRKALKLSALDFVLESARGLSGKLGREDKPKLEEFLSSVRSLEERVRGLSDAIAQQSAPMCEVMDRPPRAYAVNVSEGYDRGTHAAVMNDLIVMALRCDVTRVITHMLDDARSDFVYDHLINRKFSAEGSTEGSGKVGGFHGLQHAGDSNDGYATINWWFSQQMAELCSKLEAVQEGEGSLLDHTLILYGGAMHGSDHDGRPLPMALIGGNGAGIRTDQHVDFSASAAGRPLRDLYFTILNGYFGLDVPSFGEHVAGIPNKLISEILELTLPFF